MSEEGLVREILGDGPRSPEELKEELRTKHICFVQAYDRTFSALLGLLAALWLPPAIAQWTRWGLLRFFAELPRVDFPIGVLLGAAVAFVAALALEARLVTMRQRQGGCHDAHETIVLVRHGPYGVVRHPGYLAEMVYFSVCQLCERPVESSTELTQARMRSCLSKSAPLRNCSTRVSSLQVFAKRSRSSSPSASTELPGWSTASCQARRPSSLVSKVRGCHPTLSRDDRSTGELGAAH
jgi:hypothetical protein